MKQTGIVLILNMISCQFPVDHSELPETQKFLAIDAQVTENYLKLNVVYSLEEVTSIGGYNLPKPPLTSAYLTDSKGVKYTIKNTLGLSDTLFKGKVGETYQLYVEADGKSYVSTKETMRHCPALDSVLVIYRWEEFRAQQDELYDGFDVYAQTKDLPGEENYYQWEWVHYTKATYCGTVYSQIEKRDLLIPCNPTSCWNITASLRGIAESDKLRDGNILLKQIVRVPFTIPPNKYYLRVEQRLLPLQFLSI